MMKKVMHMKQKLIFFDGDGTVMTGDYMHPLDKEALQQLKANGHIPIFCSGRNLPNVPTQLKEIGIDTMVLSSGCTIIDQGNTVFHQCMKGPALEKVVSLFDDYHHYYTFECDDGVYMKQDLYERLMQDTREDMMIQSYQQMPIKTVMDLSTIDVNLVAWIQATYDDHEALTVQNVKDNLGEAYLCQGIFPNDEDLAGDIGLAQTSKWTGMQYVMNLYQASLEDVYAIGDGDNDIPMLSNIKYSIAMGNAPSRIQKICYYTTDHIQNAGFYLAMKHFDLI